MLSAASPAAPLAAGEPPPSRVVTVVVEEVAPFVIVEGDDQLAGFSVDLIRTIGVQLGWDVEFTVVSSVAEQFDALTTGRADLAIGAISVTAARDAVADFSHPTFTTGIQIAVADSASDPTESTTAQFWRPAVLRILAIGVVGTAAVGSLVWLVERRQNSQFAKRGRRGAFEGMWWAAETLFGTTYGDKVPRRVASRLLAVGWMLLGVLLVARLTAEVTATVTIERLENSIDSIGDLAGRTVVTVSGTTSAEYLDEREVEAATVALFDTAFDAVVSGDADAVVFDAAILRSRINATGANVRLVGPVLREEHYAIAFPSGSDLVDPTNHALLRFNESDDRARLAAAYFGD